MHVRFFRTACNLRVLPLEMYCFGPQSLRSARVTGFLLHLFYFAYFYSGSIMQVKNWDIYRLRRVSSHGVLYFMSHVDFLDEVMNLHCFGARDSSSHLDFMIGYGYQLARLC